MNTYKKHISIFFLLVFLTTKFLGLHTFSHQDDEKSVTCDICEYVIMTNTVNYTFIEFELEPFIQDAFFVEYKLFVNYQIDILIHQLILNGIKFRPPSTL